MKDIEINILSTSFPSQFATDAEKESDAFGLQVGQAIQYEWFRKDGNSCRYYGQWKDFRRLRLYARGEQSIAKYKNELAIDGDLSYLNLDWTPVPILPKFIDIVVNGMSDRLFKVKAYAQDAMSQSNRSKYQDELEAQMISKDILTTIKDKTGVDTFMMDPEQLPENDEELALFMQLKYKPAIEIAEEVGINTIFDENHFEDTRKRLNYDAAVIGIEVAKHEFLQGTGVRISYVDPANVVYSYTEDPFFKDCFYWGEIKTVPITELMKIDQSLTKEDLQEITQYSQAWYDYYNVAQFYENSLFYRDTCTLMYFNYKTTKKVIYKKKKLEGGGSRVIEKDENFNPPVEMMEEGNFEKIEKIIDVWYDGIMVMGTNILLKWELSENMVRPKSASQHALPNYITDVNDPDVTIVPGGNFNCEFYFSVNNNTGNPFTYAELYKYDGTTFTLLGTSAGVPESINQGTTIAPYYFAIPVATAALALTDRLAIRIYVNVDGRTVTLHTENGHLCH